MSDPVALSSFVEPRIKSEVVFRLTRAPTLGMNDRQLLACVEWAALGFDIAQSLFRGWQFGAPDTVAAFGLHGALFVGEPVLIDPDTQDEWFEALRRFEIQLRRPGTLAETGYARNVLQHGPLAGIPHFVEVLERSGQSSDRRR